MPTFTATLQLHGKAATGFEVPSAALDALGGGTRIPVVVTIGTHSYRSTTAMMGGRVLLPLSAENRAAAGVSAGEALSVVLARDDAPREVEVPADLAAALATDAARQAAYDALSFTARKEIAVSLTSAKRPETRARRLAAALDRLA